MTRPPIKRFWGLLKKYKYEIRLIYTYAIFIGFVNLSLPLGIQAIINYLQTGELTSGWIILVGLVLLGIAITGGLQVLQLRIVENIQQDIFIHSAFEFAYRIPKINFLQLDGTHAPELVNRFFDTVTIQKGLPKILIDFSLALFQIIFGLILLAIYSPYFIILGLALFFIMWLIFKFTGAEGLKTSLNESRFKYKLAHWLEEVARVRGSFKLNSFSNFHLEKTDKISEAYLSCRESHFQVLIRHFKFFVGFKVLLEAALLILGGFLVFQEEMDIGQFVAAEIIVILIINSIEKVMRSVETIYDVLTALDKIGFVTDMTLDKDRGNIKIESHQPIAVKAKEIQFGFPTDRNKIFRNLSFEIEPNAKTLLRGKSGTGKTILLHILAGIYQIDDGELYINGIPIGNYKKDELYNSIGVSFPQNQIFEGSFRENITMGRQIEEEALMEVINILNLNAYFAYQPNGIECPVDSGGQRLPRSIIQKLLIARLILTKPKLLLLEDPLFFIEENEKIQIVDYLMDPKREWTVVVISDFYYWAEKCTQIIDLNNNN